MGKNIELKQFDAKQWYLSNFELFENSLNGNRTNPFHELRRAAISRFSDLGFPTPRNEEWKYTNVAPILRHKFDFSERAVELPQTILQDFVFKGLEDNLLVFVNGHYSEKLSNFRPGSDGLIVDSLKKVIQNRHPIAGKYLGRLAAFEEESFTALNTAFTHDGLFVYVPNGTRVERPFQILYLSDSTDGALITHPRNLVVVGEGSELRFVESFHGLSQQVTYFNNSVTELVVERNAVIEHVKIQEESEKAFHVSNTQVHQEFKSVYTSVNIDLGAALVRNSLNIRLNAENCESHLYGFYMGRGTQHIDNHTFIDHAQPCCYSNELYKGILGDKAKGVFNGKILVRPDAQKTNALQSNKTLLLTNDASINAKPQLEIFADDVKCTHGATIGQLDDEALFYLKARGIGQDMAEAMLRYAFLRVVLEKITMESVRKNLDATLLKRLGTAEKER